MKLKTRILLLVTFVFLATMGASYLFFDFMEKDIISGLGLSFTRKEVLYNRAHTLGPLTRELTLARKLADSSTIRAWALAEFDPILRSAALRELEEYRRFFADKSYFAAVGSSLNYYFNDKAGTYTGSELRYTLAPRDPEDRWYFATIESGEPYKLNVDYDEKLGVTKVWINVVIQGKSGPLGVIGTGLDLSQFLNKVIDTRQRGVINVFVEKDGAIQAHRDVKYIDFRTISKETPERKTIFSLLDLKEDRARLQDAMDGLGADEDQVEVLSAAVGGKNYLVGIALLKEIGWYNVTLMDVGQIIGPGRFSGFVMVLGLALVMLSVSITILLNRLVIDRISRLDDSMREFGKGTLLEVPVSSARDEMGRLEEGFRRMTGIVLEKTEVLVNRIEERTRELSEQNAQLESALAEIKTLSGLLPICSNCKKIRNVDGDWEPLEEFISQRSEAEFSHSYCPACGRKARDDAGLGKKPPGK